MATYYDIAIKGDDKDLVPYVLAFRAGTDAEGIYVLSEGGFHLKSIRERLKYRGEVQHILCRAGLRAKLRAVVKKGSRRFGFEIIAEDKVKQAHFLVEFKTPSRDVAKSIRKALASLPKGVKSSVTTKETKDPSAVGTEVYSPAPDFVFQGKGEIAGDPGAVVEARRKLDDIEFVKAHEIKLDHE